MKRNKTPEQMIKECAYNIIREIGVWKHIQEQGCNDPFWPDGCNMNLTRNHILSYKREIREICEENELPLPEEYYLPTPPEVEDNYMASTKQNERVMRIRNHGVQITRNKPKYDFEQLSLF